MSRITIEVNGLSLVHEGSGGVSTSTLPDVCLTPPTEAPVAYVNVARSIDLAAGSAMVRADGGHRIAISGSRFARSTGGEPGASGGVISGVSGKDATFLSYSFDVAIEGQGACRLTDKMLHNRGNTIDCAGVAQGPARAARAASASTGKKKGKGHATDNHELTVKVIDEKTKQPIEKARIQIQGPDDVVAASDAAGQHVFEKLGRGHFEIAVTHGCYPHQKSRIVVSQKKQTRTVRLDPRSLKEVANGRKVEVGGRAVVEPYSPPDDPAVVTAHYNGIVLGTFWTSRCPDALNPVYPGSTAGLVFDYSAVDPTAAFADANGLWIEGTPLVWASAKLTPNWTKTVPGIAPKKNDTSAAKKARTKIVRELHDDFITRMIARYPQVNRWVLCNEMMNLKYKRTVLTHPFWRAFGTYRGVTCRGLANIAETFRVAHALNPKAVLIINDYDVEGWDGGHSKRGERGRLFYELVSDLVHLLAKGKRKVPRNKIAAGFQMHVPATDKPSEGYHQDYRPSSIRQQVERFRKLGVKVIVTEIDVEVAGMKQLEKEQTAALAKGTDLGAFTTKNQKRYTALFRTQQKRYYELLRAVLDGGNCNSVTTWSLRDGPTQFRPLGYMMGPYIGLRPAEPGILQEARILRRSGRDARLREVSRSEVG